MGLPVGVVDSPGGSKLAPVSASAPDIDFARVRAIVLDVDGVLTGAHVLATEGGELVRALSIRDGYAIKRALRAGLRVAIITGGRSEGVRKRFAALGVDDYYSGVQDKAPVLRAYAERHGVALADVLYAGDDLPDLGPLRICGIACAPADACAEVLAEADYVSPRRGGEHCGRDIVEQVLRAQGKWLPA